MRSFISSFERIRKIRTVPLQPWVRVLAVGVVAAVVMLGGWEMTARAAGYVPSIRDTPDLWAMSRDRVKRHDDGKVLVITGASRIRFGLDHDIMSEAFGGLPVVNLAMDGGVVRPVLHDLAQDEGFRGIVICDYVPNLFWMPGGPLLEESASWVEKYPRRTLSGRFGQQIAVRIEGMLAFLNNDLTLGKLIETRVKLPNRDGVMLPPEFPPFLAVNRLDRREVMWEKLEKDPAFQDRIKGIWQGLFSMATALPPELVGKMRAEVAADVKAIRDRGGDVIFVRFPSTGWLREWENETAPREAHWEPLLQETGCLGIHFEDYPELGGFDCPEWSHLSGADAEKFSRGLARIVREKYKGNE
jgi:hypothetical protein